MQIDQDERWAEIRIRAEQVLEESRWLRDYTQELREHTRQQAAKLQEQRLATSAAIAESQVRRQRS
jgi:hypothetical protein